MKLDPEGRVTIKQLAAHGHSGREIARLLGVCESTVRYHLERHAYQTPVQVRQAFKNAA